MTDFIPVNEPILTGNEKKYLNQCIDTGWISSEGPFVDMFEKNFSKQVNREYGITVTNGTAAIDVAIEALGIKTGDEVIMPTFTIISCVLQIVRSGATPVFIDCDPVTWNMNVTDLEELITPRTKAIMVVHIYGLPVEMAPVLRIARKYDLKVIEDAAQMIGQTYNGEPCGSFGDISTFSFYPNKHITTGEGGMIVTDCEELNKECRSLRNLCFKEGRRFVHESLGWNLRMSNIQAALGQAQLERLDEFVSKKREMGRIYNSLLSSLTCFEFPKDKTEYAENIYWVYGLVLKDEVEFDADIAIKKLAELGVGARPFFWCLHEQPYFNKQGLFLEKKYPVAERLARRGFYIPSGLSLEEPQLVRVAEALFEVFSEYC